MKIIKCLSELIEEELEASCHYIKKALKYKDEYRSVTDMWYMLSLDEMKHVDMNHNEVVKLIKAYREENGEPPEKMQFVYEYLHEKHIKKAQEIKILQELYKT